MANLYTVVLIFALLLLTRELKADGGPRESYVLCGIYNTLLLETGSQLGINGFSDTDLDDATPCSHLLFMSHPIHHSTLDEMNDNSSGTDEVDLRAAYFRRGEQLKRLRPELKLILSTGVSSRSVETEERRASLLRYTVSFLKRHKMDGLLLQCQSSGGNGADTCVQLYKSLSLEMGKHNLTLFVFLPGDKFTDFDASQHAVIERYSELVLIETLKSPRISNNITQIMNPLVTENATIEWYLGQGIPIHKMVVMFPLFAETYKLKNSKENGLGAESVGPGLESKGVTSWQLSSSEMLKRLKNPEESWVVRRDTVSNSPYAVNSDGIWATYEDFSSLRSKAHYLRNVGIGGVMIMTLELDDYRGDEGIGRFPLTRAFTDALRSNK